MLSLILLSASTVLIGQSKLIKGFVVDNETYQGLSLVHVFTAYNKGEVTSQKGYFEIEVELQDTLVFSRVNYDTKRIAIIDLPEESEVIIALENRTFQLDSIIIIPEYTHETILKRKVYDLPLHLRPTEKLSLNERENNYKPLGVLGSAFHPIEGIFRLTSKRYREEKQYLDVLKREARMEQIDSLAYANLGSALKILNLKIKEDRYPELLRICNFSVITASNSNDYELILALEKCMQTNEWLKFIEH